MTTIHLRAPSDRRPGETKDWIISDETGQLVVQFGETGRKLNSKGIGIDTIPDRDIAAELQRRAHAKLREGYQSVDGTASLPMKDPERLYIRISKRQSRQQKLIDMLDENEAALADGIPYRINRSKSEVIFNADGVDLSTKGCAIETTRRALVVQLAALLDLADVSDVSISDDTTQVANTENLAGRSVALHPSLVELAYTLGVRQRPLRFAAITGRTGGAVVPVVF